MYELIDLAKNYGAGAVMLFAAAKLFLGLLAILIGVTLGTGDGAQKFGKTIMAFLGGLFVFWIGSTLPSVGMAKEELPAYLLGPATSFGEHAVVGISSAAGVAILFFVVEFFLFNLSAQLIFGVCAFLTSAAISALVPLCMILVGSLAADIASTRLFDASVGVLFGGLFYIAVRSILSGDSVRVSPPPPG
jgi:hypothetical protein